MKAKNKDTLKTAAIIGGGIAAIYLLMPSDTAPGGGFGGGGGIPLLPGDVEEAAVGGTVINYLFPEAKEGFEVFDVGGDADVPMKKDLDLSKYDPRTPGFTLGVTPTTPTPYSIKGAAMYEAGELPGWTPKKESVVKPDKPKQWGEASIEGFFDFLAPLTQLGKGARGRDIALDTKKMAGGVTATQEVEARKVSTVATAHKQAVKKQESRASGRYWRMTGTNQVPGWKQVGAREPTAPGQPDVY